MLPPSSHAVRPAWQSAGGCCLGVPEEKRAQDWAHGPRCGQMGTMRRLHSVASLGLCLLSMAVLAEPDTFGLGNGQHGPLRVQRMETTVNIATALTATAPAGTQKLAVADVSGFAAGELILLLQVYAESSPPPAEAPIELESTGAGRWEFARLESVAPGELGLTAPLVSAFIAPGSQVVRVPEYTSVQVQLNSSLSAPPWDGSSGGVLVFLATDAVLNQGTLSADGAGFRGGAFATNPPRSTGCTEPNQSAESGGAQKGEGISSAAGGAPTSGHGALANGAGGGNCEDGGGGGGGHGGAGGQGGYTAAADGSRDVGGRGGAALKYPALTRMVFGGGGGAGAGGASSGPAGAGGSSGGAGGGIIYIRARDFQGSQGRITARGQSAAPAGTDGAGGGGAGGHITVRVVRRLDCTALEANGGNGGSNTDTRAHGPGGGGGGGVVLLQAETMGCPASALPGLAGSAAGAPDGGSYGATPTSAAQPENQGSSVSLSEAFATPGVPVWVLPAQGEQTGPRPRLEGTAQPGSKVLILLNGASLGSVPASESGGFAFQPEADLAQGAYEVRAAAERLGVRSAFSQPRAFNVGERVPLALEVGCGCGATQAAGGAWLALGLLLLQAARAGVRRRRASAHKRPSHLE
jgi:hypothetical protein